MDTTLPTEPLPSVPASDYPVIDQESPVPALRKGSDPTPSLLEGFLGIFTQILEPDWLSLVFPRMGDREQPALERQTLPSMFSVGSMGKTGFGNS